MPLADGATLLLELEEIIQLLQCRAISAANLSSPQLRAPNLAAVIILSTVTVLARDATKFTR